MTTENFAFDGDAPALAIAYGDIERAAERIRSHVVRTPVLPSENLSSALNCDVWFKAENLQASGAFKARGACNAVLSVSDAVANRGFVTHSSGNHAAAVARAARRRGVPVAIVMPENSVACKIANVKRHGAEPIFCGPTAPERQAAADRLLAETGGTLIHPFNQPEVIAGQGTVGLEIAEDLSDIDQVLVPLGGGGLLSGTLIALRQRMPDVRVVGVEPAWADDAHRSLDAGCLQPALRYDSIADGLRTPLGDLTFPIIRHLVDRIELVQESSILKATRMLSEQAHLVGEPSGAVTLAAMIQSPDTYRGQRVVCIISGGNLDFGQCRLGTPS